MAIIRKAVIYPIKLGITKIDSVINNEIIDWVKESSGEKIDPVKIELEKEGEWIKATYSFDFNERQMNYYNNVFIASLEPKKKQVVDL